MLISTVRKNVFMRQRQLQLLTNSELAAMRDRTKARNYSAAADEFRREHARHRHWGLARRHAQKLCRSHGCSAECGAVGLHDVFEEVPPLVWDGEATVVRPPRRVPGGEVRVVRDVSPSREQQPGDAGRIDQAPVARRAEREARVKSAREAKAAGPALAAGHAQRVDQAEVADRVLAKDQAQATDQARASAQGLATNQAKAAQQAKAADRALGTSQAQATGRALVESQTQAVDQAGAADLAESTSRREPDGHCGSAVHGEWRRPPVAAARPGPAAASGSPRDQQPPAAPQQPAMRRHRRRPILVGRLTGADIAVAAHTGYAVSATPQSRGSLGKTSRKLRAVNQSSTRINARSPPGRQLPFHRLASMRIRDRWADLGHASQGTTETAPDSE
ncbi:hypothetical protein [Actinoplanes sp. NPDC026619]|uniref:hypothetical protein n=1 Tax=Actinoplanes sp. NPDC026619 TaxID=3155798 RepID=UPI0033DDE3DF